MAEKIPGTNEASFCDIASSVAVSFSGALTKALVDSANEK